MGLMRYGCFPTARMQLCYLTAGYQDLAVLDFSTRGHALFNYGHRGWMSPAAPEDRLFSAQLSETDIATGSSKKLYAAVDEILDKGYRHIFLLPTALSEVMGQDLEGLVTELQDRADIFTVKVKLNADYYEGSEKLYTALAKRYAVPCERRPFTYNILGGYTYADQIDHGHIRELLEGLDLKCAIDVQKIPSLQALEELPLAAVNIVTSKFALKAAQELKRANGTPYVIFDTLTPQGEDRFLAAVAELTGREAPASRQDGIYDGLRTQLGNILSVTAPEIVCYGDTDKLSALEEFFGGLYDRVTYLCSHKRGDYPYASPDEVVSRYGDRVVLTYDHLCRYIPMSLPIAESGLIYRLHTPLKDYTIGRDGGYRLMKALGEKLL